MIIVTKNIDIFIYVISLYEFNDKDLEYSKNNTMKKSLSLFEKDINMDFLKEKPVLLVFTKKDILEDKRENDLSKEFLEYKGSSVDDEVNFIQKLYFSKIIELENRQIEYVYANLTRKDSFHLIEQKLNDIISKNRIKYVTL